MKPTPTQLAFLVESARLLHRLVWQGDEDIENPMAITLETVCGLVVRCGIKPEKVHPSHCEREQKWYGWSLYGFGIGDGDCCTGRMSASRGRPEFARLKRWKIAREWPLHWN